MNTTYDNKGSITLEASLVVPIFIIIMMFFYGIMMMFSGEELIAHSMLQSGKSLSLDSYVNGKESVIKSNQVINDMKEIFSNLGVSEVKNSEYFSAKEQWYVDKDKIKIGKEVKKRFLGFLSGGDEQRADSLLKVVGVDGGIDEINFSESYIDDNNDLHLILKYQQYFLFDLNGKVSFERKKEVVTHMWSME